jgi:hypothetical protein
MPTEQVHAVWGYWDGIRSGVADFDGKPVYFEQEWSEETDDYSASFRLKPVSPTVLADVLEQSQIFRTWELRFHNGEVEQDTHPGLLGQSTRYAELESKLKDHLAKLDALAVRVGGKFLALPNQEHLPAGAMRQVRVEWHGVA